MHKIKQILLSLILLIPFVLTSCLFPEEFESQVQINKNGTFSFTYDGILTFILGKAEEAEEGKLSPKADKEIQELEKELKKDKNFKSVKYIGNSKFKVVYKKEGDLSKPFYFLGTDVKIFSIIPKEDGIIEVVGIRLSKKDIKELEAMNITIDGKLTVDTNGVVVEHNAKSTPSLFGLVGGYQWKIKTLSDPTPKIIIKLK